MALLTPDFEQCELTGQFIWAAGIEDTFITEPWPATGRTLDEYELTGHYQHCRQDIALLAELGIRAARYGLPWHKINPEPGQWDWSFADAAIERFRSLGIDPIIDLVHYGLPRWLPGAFLNPDFPARAAEFAARVAERYKGSLRFYTPLNEPRVTAWYCGKLGWWPPARRGWRGFIALMLAICRGIVQTVQALRAVDPDVQILHVDATDLYDTEDPALANEAAHRQEIVFLALDLVSGRVSANHPLASWLLRNGATDTDLVWFQNHSIDLPVLGLNLYPMFSRKVLTRSSAGRLRIQMPYTTGNVIERLAQLYWQRYRRPIFISETASVGSVRRRMAWLQSSVAAVRRARQQGIPLVGYTWWPLFALVTWAYRQGTHPPAFYLKQMGLWDLDPEPAGNLRRVATPLVREYQQLVRAGAAAVGQIIKTPQHEPLTYVS